MEKILIFNSGSFLYGSERGLINVVKVFKDQYEITVVLPQRGPLIKILQEFGVKIKIFPLSILSFSFSPFYYIRYLFWFLLDSAYFFLYIFFKKIDIIYTNNSLIIFPCLLAKLLGKKHIWHIREFFHLKFINKFIAKIIGSFSSLVICQSENIKKALFPTGNPKVKVIYEGIDSNSYRIKDYFSVKKRLSLSPDAVVVSVISRIHPFKGQYEFIKLIPDIIKGLKRDVFFLIAGDVSSKNFRENIYKRKIIKFIINNKLNGKILLLGFVENIEEILSVTDICVFPCQRNEPFGMALVESLVFVEDVFVNFNPGFEEIDYFFNNKCKKISIWAGFSSTPTIFIPRKAWPRWRRASR